MSESIEHAGAAVVDAADGLAGHLAALLGGEHVLTDATSRRLHAQDVHGSGVPPLALVRPGSVDELAVAVRLVTAGCLALMFAGGVMLATLHAKLAMPALYLFGLGWGGDYTMLQGLVADVFGARSLGPRVTGALFDVTQSDQLGFSVIVVLIAASLAAILFVRLPERAAH